MISKGCFITGTDTDVGKTRISAGLLHWLAERGLRSAGLKPVAAGASLIDGAWINDDVQALRLAGSLPLTAAEVGPLQLRTACAPHIAAQIEGRCIDRVLLLRAARDLATRADVLVVEGVGGFCVPLGDDWDSADLARDLALPVLLVVGLRLGCLNHALLTAEAVRARGLPLIGWIANMPVSAAMPHAPQNLASLEHELMRRHAAPCLGVVPWLPQPSPAAVAAHFDAAALQAALALAPQS
jgi:dethiobiotin synthetase